MDQPIAAAARSLRRAGFQREDVEASVMLVASGAVSRVVIAGLVDPVGTIADIRRHALAVGVVVEPMEQGSAATAVLIRRSPIVSA